MSTETHQDKEFAIIEDFHQTCLDLIENKHGNYSFKQQIALLARTIFKAKDKKDKEQKQKSESYVTNLHYNWHKFTWSLLNRAMEIKGDQCNVILEILDIKINAFSDVIDCCFWEGKEWHKVADYAMKKMNRSLLEHMLHNENLEYLGESRWDFDLWLLPALEKLELSARHQDLNAKDTTDIYQFTSRVKKDFLQHGDLEHLVWYSMVLSNSEMLKDLQNKHGRKALVKAATKIERGLVKGISSLLKKYSKWMELMFLEWDEDNKHMEICESCGLNYPHST